MEYDKFNGWFSSKKQYKKAIDAHESRYQKLLIQFRDLLVENHQLKKELDTCRDLNEAVIHKGVRKEVEDEV